MKMHTRSMHITPVGGNIFADLGFQPKEAAALQAESKRIIAEKKARRLTPSVAHEAGKGKGKA